MKEKMSEDQNIKLQNNREMVFYLYDSNIERILRDSTGHKS